MSANTPQFLGLKNVDSGKALATWFAQYNSGDVAQANAIPGVSDFTALAFNAAYKYIVDIQAVQANYAFGPFHKLRIDIQQNRAWQDQSNNGYFPGRVFVYVPSTQELFSFTTEDTVALPTVTGGVAPRNPECLRVVEHVLIPAGSPIEIWLESDVTIAAGVLSVAPPDAVVRLNVYNF